MGVAGGMAAGASAAGIERQVSGFELDHVVEE